jgi:hypothetical protein
MEPQASLPGAGHGCSRPNCCGPEAAEGNAATSLQGEPSPAGPGNPAGSLAGSLKNWLLWFLAFFGIYASSSMCPFCGTPGCPVGAGGAALAGGVFATLWQYGKQVWERLRIFCIKPAR